MNRTVCLLILLALSATVYLVFDLGLREVLEGALSVLDFFRDQLVTIVFVLVLGSVAVWIVRLHLSGADSDRKLNLLDLITTKDGRFDGEKIAAWLARGSGLYGFFYNLYHNPTIVVAYAGLFFTVMLGHLVANRMTATPQPPPPKLGNEPG